MRKRRLASLLLAVSLAASDWPDVVREERRKPLRQRQEDRLKRRGQQGIPGGRRDQRG